jgi:hypothetical protein
MRTGAEGMPIGGGGKSNTSKEAASLGGLVVSTCMVQLRGDPLQFVKQPGKARFRKARPHGLATPNVRVGAAKRVLEIKRAQGRPGAGRTHGPPATKKAGGSHHRLSQIIRPSLRDGVTVSCALSPGTGLSCPRHCSGLLPRNLAPASGRQDHTPSPSASASFVRATCARSTPPASIASRTHVS